MDEARRKHASFRDLGAGIALLLLVSTPLFYQLGRWPLAEPDEGRNAEVAREMLTQRSWVVPHFNGLPFLDKPPLLFWMIAGAFRAIGVSEIGARLPAAVGGVALILLTFAMTRTLLGMRFGARQGLLAAVIVGTSPLFLIFGRLAIFDMPFTALTTLALCCLVQGRLGGRPMVWVPLAGLAMGIATLAKGPVGVAVPLLAWMAARGALPAPEGPQGKLPTLGAILLYLGVVVPWLAMVAIPEPGFLHYALLDETVLRFWSPARFHRAGPLYYPALVLALGFGVWTAVLLGLSPLLVRRASGSSSEAIAIRFCARAAGAILLFFSVCASKRPGYVLPAMVPLSVLTAIGVMEAWHRAAASVRVVAFGAVLIGLIAATLGLIDAGWINSAVFSKTTALSGPVLVAGGVLFLTWGLLTMSVGRFPPVVALALAAALVPGVYIALLNPLGNHMDGLSARRMASLVPPNAEVWALRKFRTSLPFYLGHPVFLASQKGTELTSNYVLARHEQFMGHGNLVKPRRFWARLREAPMVYVLTGQARAKYLIGRSPRTLALVYADRGYVLLATTDRDAQ